MPIDYRIVDPHRLVVIRAWGILDDDSLVTHARRFTSDPAVIRTYDQYADYTGVTGFPRVTPSGIAEGGAIMDAFEKDTPGIKLALVMGSLAAFGLGRMYQLFRRAPIDINVFRNHADALAWMGRPSEALEVPAQRTYDPEA